MLQIGFEFSEIRCQFENLKIWFGLGFDLFGWNA